MSDHDENIFINPEELKPTRPTRATIKKEEKPVNGKKFINKGLQVQVNFETMGRFSIPPTIYFKDFSIEDVGNFSMCKVEDVLENVVVSLNKLKDENTNVELEEMTQQEFIEALVGIKSQFNSPIHEHRYLCDCQENVDDSERKASIVMINLNELKYKSVLDVDNELKKEYTELFDSMTDDEFKVYVKQKYKEEAFPDFVNSWTKEKELSALRFKEPFYYYNPDLTQEVYGFRMIRVKDLLEAQRVIDPKYQLQIRKAQKAVPDANESLADAKIQKQIEIEKIKESEAKELIFYAKALSLVSVNDDTIEDPQEKLNIYKALSKEVLFDLEDFLDKINIGIDHEYEAVCPHCKRTNRGLLQHETLFYEFIPVKSDTTKRKKESPRRYIYFGK